MLKLIVSPGDPAERTIEIGAQELVIGRAPENPIYVLHPSLSRRHAKIEARGDGVLLTDLGSRNGTVAYGVSVRCVALRPGDMFSCGEVEFRVVDDEHVHVVVREEPTLVSFEIKNRPPAPAPELPPDPEERVRRKHDALLEAVATVAGSASPDEIVADLLGLLFRVFPIDRAAVLLVDPISGELRATAWKSISGDDVSRADRERIGRRLRVRGSPSLLGDEVVPSAIGAPIERRGEVLGALYADSTSVVDAFTEHDVAFFAAVAKLAAIAIDSGA